MTQREIIKELLRTMQPMLNMARQELESVEAGYSGPDPHILYNIITNAKEAMKIARKAVKK